eukprot:Anaeramoba_ignava/c20765_g1_i1.p2 GENE.c20765_g1_i1~~c20765_g1_i1.p2  ORF type:complete len:279 (+),score=103.94 c20765_g1_i1:1496-2332(+)
MESQDLFELSQASLIFKKMEDSLAIQISPTEKKRNEKQSKEQTILQKIHQNYPGLLDPKIYQDLTKPLDYYLENPLLNPEIKSDWNIADKEKIHRARIEVKGKELEKIQKQINAKISKSLKNKGIEPNIISVWRIEDQRKWNDFYRYSKRKNPQFNPSSDVQEAYFYGKRYEKFANTVANSSFFSNTLGWSFGRGFYLFSSLIQANDFCTFDDNGNRIVYLASVFQFNPKIISSTFGIYLDSHFDSISYKPDDQKKISTVFLKETSQFYCDYEIVYQI